MAASESTADVERERGKPVIDGCQSGVGRTSNQYCGHLELNRLMPERHGRLTSTGHPLRLGFRVEKRDKKAERERERRLH